MAEERTTQPEPPVASTLVAMSLSVHVPEDLARRLTAAAQARHQTPEQVALEAIEAQLPPRRRLSFAAVGSSGSGGGDIARRHKEIIAADFADKTAADL